MIPAYGRDYRNPEAVMRDWLGGKDFRIADVSSEYDGKYVGVGEAFELLLAAGATLRRMSAGDPYDNGEPEPVPVPVPVTLEPVSPQPLPSPLTITAASGH